MASTKLLRRTQVLPGDCHSFGLSKSPLTGDLWGRHASLPTSVMATHERAGFALERVHACRRAPPWTTLRLDENPSAERVKRRCGVLFVELDLARVKDGNRVALDFESRRCEVVVVASVRLWASLRNSRPGRVEVGDRRRFACWAASHAARCAGAEGSGP